MTSQLNIRMDLDLRKAGDKALAEVGYTSGDFIRALWEKLAERGKALEAIRAILSETPTPDNTEAEDAALGRMDELCSLVQSSFVHGDTTPYISPSDAAELDRELLWDEIDGRCGRDAV